jgi:hypothetical protein
MQDFASDSLAVAGLVDLVSVAPREKGGAWGSSPASGQHGHLQPKKHLKRLVRRISTASSFLFERLLVD